MTPELNELSSLRGPPLSRPLRGPSPPTPAPSRGSGSSFCSREGRTSGCWQHVREPLPSGHHFWILFQISEILPDPDGAIILGRKEVVRTQARLSWRQAPWRGERLGSGMGWLCPHSRLGSGEGWGQRQGWGPCFLLRHCPFSQLTSRAENQSH